MIQRTEGTFKGQNGVELFFQTWSGGKARGTLVVTHGMAEHSECYHLFASNMVPRGWDVFAWDLRGHGRSEGKRGHVDSFKLFSEDLHLFITQLQEHGRFKDKPFFLVGHSLGGLIVLRNLIDFGAQGATAACFSSPLLGVAMPVPAYKEAAAKLLNRFMPSTTLYNEIRYQDLSRDPEILASYPHDTLRHEKISPPLYFGMLDSIQHVFANAEKITLPVLFQLAGRDLVVNRMKSEEFFELLTKAKKEMLIYEGNYHEIFNDLDRKIVYGDLHAFLEKTLAGIK